MIKIIYFDERELLIRREIETKTLKDTEAKIIKVLPQMLIVVSLTMRGVELMIS